MKISKEDVLLIVTNAIENFMKSEGKGFSKTLNSVIKQAENECQRIIDREEVVFQFELIENGKRIESEETFYFQLGEESWKDFVKKSKDSLSACYGGVKIIEIFR